MPRALTVASLRPGTMLAAVAGERQRLGGSRAVIGVSDETRSHTEG